MIKKIKIWFVEDKHTNPIQELDILLGQNNYDLLWTTCMKSAWRSITDFTKRSGLLPDLMAFDVMLPEESNNVIAKKLFGKTIGHKDDSKSQLEFYDNYVHDIDIQKELGRFYNQHHKVIGEKMLPEGGIYLYAYLINRIKALGVSSIAHPEVLIYSAHSRIRQTYQPLQQILGVVFFGKSFFVGEEDNTTCYWYEKYEDIFRNILWKYNAAKLQKSQSVEDSMYPYKEPDHGKTDCFIINRSEFPSLPLNAEMFKNVIKQIKKEPNEIWFKEGKIVRDLFEIKWTALGQIEIMKKQKAVNENSVEEQRSRLIPVIDAIVKKKISNGEVYLVRAGEKIDEIIKYCDKRDFKKVAEIFKVLLTLPLTKNGETTDKDYWTFFSLFGHRITELQLLLEKKEQDLQQVKDKFIALERQFFVRDLSADFCEAFNMYAVKQATHNSIFYGAGEDSSSMNEIFEEQMQKILRIVEKSVPEVPVRTKLENGWVKSGDVLTHIRSFYEKRPYPFNIDAADETLTEERFEGFQFSPIEIISHIRENNLPGLLNEKPRIGIAKLGKNILGDNVVEPKILDAGKNLFIPVHTLFSDLFEYIFTRINQKSFLNGLIAEEHRKVQVLYFPKTIVDNDAYTLDKIYIAIKTTGVPFPTLNSLRENDITASVRKSGMDYFGKFYISSLIDYSDQLSIDIFNNKEISLISLPEDLLSLQCNSWIETNDGLKHAEVSNQGPNSNWVNLFLFEFTRKEGKPL